MFDTLISIPGPVFLVYFSLYAAITLIAGRIYIQHLNTNKNARVPGESELGPYETAALRSGIDGIIQTAVFNLWTNKYIVFGGETSLAKIYTAEGSAEPEDPVEKNIYRSIAQNSFTADELLKNADLREKTDMRLQQITKKLYSLGLLRSEQELAVIKKIKFFIAAVMLLPGLAKLMAGIIYNRPVTLLVVLLIFSAAIWVVVFSQAQFKTSPAGKKLLKVLKKKYTLEKTQDNPLMRVAALGIAGIAGYAVFSQFSDVFASTGSDSTTGYDGGSCSGGGCSGGGCGGCGGD